MNAAGEDLPGDASNWVMVRDNVTGLIWEVKGPGDGSQNHADPHDADNKYTWYNGDTGTSGEGTDTLDFLNALNDGSFGGYSDWRLPGIHDLFALPDRASYGPSMDTAYFPSIKTNSYWTGTTDDVSSQNAWLVYFYYGEIEGGQKSSSWYVRGVRGTPFTNDFVNNGDSTVTDQSTGLTWEVKSDDDGDRDKDNTYTWEQALAYCENLNLGGHSDWRLPDLHELQSIVDYGNHYPAISLANFPNTPHDGSYWCSTTDPESNSKAWRINFWLGMTERGGKTAPYRVRAVRGGLAATEAGVLPGVLLLLE
jgi:hypothetical protein